MTHPTLEELFEVCLARHRGEKGPATAEKHLSATCSVCEGRLQEIGHLVHAMITDRAPDPPSAWVERAIALFPKASFASRLAEFGRGLAEEAGRLVFSSWGSDLPAFAGSRGASTLQRLRFEAGGLELDLQIDRTGRSGSLLGQLLKLNPLAPCAGARLLATAGNSQMAEGVSDELGEFQLFLSDLADVRVRVSTEGRLVIFEIPAPAVEE